VLAKPEKAEYEIEFPMVENFHDPGIVQVKVNWDRVGDLEWAPGGGRDQAAGLTVCRAWCSSNCAGLK
jgi:hypothetical protein